MKRIFHIAAFATLLLPGLVFAHQGGEQMHGGPNKAVGKYIKEQIMPVLLQKRQQFDAELNVSEKAEIADCRAALKQLETQHHEQRIAEKSEGSQHNHYYGDDHHANPEFAQHKAIIQRLEAIADKHSNSLQQLKTELEPARAQWMNDIHKLQATANNYDKAKTEDSKPWQHERSPFPFPGMHHMAAHFLLLQASPATVNPTASGQQEDLTAVGSTAAVTNLTSFQLMPNPATNDVQLGNEMLPATNMLKVIDLQGKEVMSLENVQAAQHIDVSQLVGGTYLVQIKSGDKTVSKKIVISK